MGMSIPPPFQKDCHEACPSCLSEGKMLFFKQELSQDTRDKTIILVQTVVGLLVSTQIYVPDNFPLSPSQNSPYQASIPFGSFTILLAQMMSSVMSLDNKSAKSASGCLFWEIQRYHTCESRAKLPAQLCALLADLHSALPVVLSRGLVSLL